MIDYLIVGQGLAGVTLAWKLLDLDQKILLIDVNRENTSSRVAAGLYNPVTGRKMTKTWRADDLFPTLISFYKEKESLLEATFFHEKVIYRPFKSIEEQNEWLGKSSNDHYKGYIKSLAMESQSTEYKDKLGGVSLNNSGFLDVPEYLNASISYFDQFGVEVRRKVFEPKNLTVTEEYISYEDIKAKNIIFCRGVTDSQENLFSWLPFAPVKGEILKIKAEIQLDYILNRGVFIIPKKEGDFKVGSTYNNHDLTSSPTEQGRAEIEAKLNDLIDVNYGVTEQHAGVRPATKDRKPFLGMHPKYKNVGIFNGLGAKGVSLAPYFANQFAQHLVNRSELDKEVNITRYYSLYEN